ncbi:DUF599 domain-containing protein [Methylopila turkensis]|uniref:Membrane protein n=1 Tax=Methylopila turkensis TaxID=1437816 RepID=A0A9W6JNU8_9HYPH|nr:DUF599 family protein [Methylopila turkensis]GLK81076.1 membrane protein [Methylopila turkensis]
MTSLYDLSNLIAIAYFLLVWFGHFAWSEHSPASLNSVMEARRRDWMRRMAARENRMPDAIAMQGLQNGSAFFASTTLLAVGGCFAALGASGEAIEVFSYLPLGIAMTREVYDVKVLGMAAILVYAFFKFVWSYRLFNYCSILVVCTPPREELGMAETAVAIERAARMNIEAGRHFNRGLRGVFFSLAYLGWFASPWALMATTTVVTIILHRRQFDSKPLEAASYDG